jgi:hypothetical protein
MSDDKITFEPELEHNNNHATAAPVAPHTPSFPQFKRMLIELRLQIWPLNYPGPRLVEVEYDDKLKQFYTPTLLPTNLLVCSQTRSEAKIRYPLRFATEDSPAMIRVNFEIDTIRMDYKQCIIAGVTPSADIPAVKFLELHHVHFKRRFGIRDIFKSILAFENLRQLTVACTSFEGHLGSRTSTLFSALLSQFGVLHAGEDTTLFDPYGMWRGLLEAVGGRLGRRKARASSRIYISREG